MNVCMHESATLFSLLENHPSGWLLACSPSGNHQYLLKTMSDHCKFPGVVIVVVGQHIHIVIGIEIYSFIVLSFHHVLGEVGEL